MEIHNEEGNIKVLDGRKFAGHHLTKINNGYIVTVWAAEDGEQVSRDDNSEKYYLINKQAVKEFCAELVQLDIA